MFRLTITRPLGRRSLFHRETLAESSTPDSIFDRLIEETEALRRICGFDSELVRASDLMTQGMLEGRA